MDIGKGLQLTCINAFLKGEAAKKHGWMRVSPFYDSPVEDDYFFGGYDGDDFDFITAKVAAKYAPGQAS